MTLARPTYPLLVVGASLAMIAEAIVAQRDHLPLWLAIPCVIATGGLVLFAGVAFDTLARGAIRPDKRDIAAVRDLQQCNTALLDVHAEQLARAETRLAFLCAQQPLLEQQHEVAAAAARIETWGAVSADLPAWTLAVERWKSTLERAQADIDLDMSVASDAELQTARASLPPTRNFSSPDLKAALAYLVQRERVAAAYDQLQTYGRMLSD